MPTFPCPAVSKMLNDPSLHQSPTFHHNLCQLSSQIQVQVDAQLHTAHIPNPSTLLVSFRITMTNNNNDIAQTAQPFKISSKIVDQHSPQSLPPFAI